MNNLYCLSFVIIFLSSFSIHTGLDLAHIRNGYVYHTRNDLPRFVEPGCLQRTGRLPQASLSWMGYPRQAQVTSGKPHMSGLLQASPS